MRMSSRACLRCALAVLSLSGGRVVGAADTRSDRGGVYRGGRGCSARVDPPNLARNGASYTGVPLVAGINATLGDCTALCCADPKCLAFAFHTQHSTITSPLPVGCVSDTPCCLLKATVPAGAPSAHGGKVTTAVLERPKIPFPTPPGNRSTFISSCRVLSNSTVSSGVEGDTWPSTWLSNGSSYAMGCDNTQPGEPMAFMNWWSTGSDPLSLRLINNAPIPTKTVIDVCGKHFGNDTTKGNIKPSSVLAVNNTIYAGVQCISYFDGANASIPGRQRAWNAWIITSTDGGASWNLTATRPSMFQGRLANPVFIQAGRGHQEAPDRYVYLHFPAAAVPPAAYWDANEFLLLGRVPTADLLSRSAYTFWTGEGWDSDASTAAPVFQYPFMLGQDHTFYVPGLRRYFLPNYGFVDRDSGEPVSWHGYYAEHHRAPTSQLTLYEAPAPQGPWSLVHVEQPWTLGGNGAYCPDFPARWWSGDRATLEMVMVASACCGQPGYSYHTTRVVLTLG